MRAALLALLMLLAADLANAHNHDAAASFCAEQPDGQSLCLERPASRIISLAPHLTESLYAIGAGRQIIGTTDYSDFPPEALKLPRIGRFDRPDIERILALKPDLLVVWSTGTPASQIERLRALGLKVWIARGVNLKDIPHDLIALGRLSGHEAQATALAQAFNDQLDQLRQRYASARKLRAFYEIWPHPLLTVSQSHFIGQAMTLCGLDNIAAQASTATPSWSEEDVITRRTELLLTSPPARDFERWRRWKELPAVRHDLLIILPADVMLRPGPRLIEGIKAMCEAGDKARSNLP